MAKSQGTKPHFPTEKGEQRLLDLLNHQEWRKLQLLHAPKLSFSQPPSTPQQDINYIYIYIYLSKNDLVTLKKE